MEHSCWCQSPDASCLHSSSNCIWISHHSGLELKGKNKVKKKKVIISKEKTLFFFLKIWATVVYQSWGKRYRTQHNSPPAEQPSLIPWPVLACCNCGVKYIHFGITIDDLGEHILLLSEVELTTLAKSATEAQLASSNLLKYYKSCVQSCTKSPHNKKSGKKKNLRTNSLSSAKHSWGKQTSQKYNASGQGIEKASIFFFYMFPKFCKYLNIGSWYRSAVSY